MSQKNSSPKEVSLTELLTQIDEIVRWFESDQFELERASAKFKEARALSAQVEERLNLMQNEVTLLRDELTAG